MKTRRNARGGSASTSTRTRSSYDSSTSGALSIADDLSAISRRTITTITSKSTAPERNTTLMLLAATSPLRTGLIAEPISDALERKPKPTRARCEALPIPR